jgi:hypothetical protein
MPPKMLACQRSLTKYSHADIIEEFYLARTVLTMLKLRDDREGREMARYLEWLLLSSAVSGTKIHLPLSPDRCQRAKQKCRYRPQRHRPPRSARADC